MPDEIKMSKFNFWLVTAILSAGIVGFGTWAASMNNGQIEQRIAMAEMKTIVTNLDSRLKENLNLKDRLRTAESKLDALQVQVATNREELLSTRGIGFNMPDYDKYARPVQEDLLDRVTRLEASR